jgi:hypothetical protein
MQFTNMYIMANGIKNLFVDKIEEKKTRKFWYDDMACYSTSY